MSNNQKITSATLDRLDRGKVYDAQSPGLWLEVRNNGSKIWRYRRRIANAGSTVAPLKATLGQYPAYSIADARAWARSLNDHAERGEDPRTLFVKLPERELLTVDQCHVRYLAAIEKGDWKKLKPRTISDKRYIYDSEIKSSLGNLAIIDISDDHLWELVETKGESAPVRANRLAAELKVFFGWCSGRRGKRAGINLSIDPSRTLEGRFFKETSRDRFLEEWEIALFLQSIAQEQPLYRRALLLLALTGVRKMEALSARRTEYRDGVWSVPSERTKNGSIHEIHLGQWGRSIFEGEGLWLFPSSIIDGPMLYGWYKVLDRVRARMAFIHGGNVEPFTLHDLRRTMRSHTDALGISPAAAEAMLNHTRKGIEKIYNRSVSKEKASGFIAWEQKLISLAPTTRLDL